MKHVEKIILQKPQTTTSPPAPPLQKTQSLPPLALPLKPQSLPKARLPTTWKHGQYKSKQ